MNLYQAINYQNISDDNKIQIIKDREIDLKALL